MNDWWMETLQVVSCSVQIVKIINKLSISNLIRLRQTERQTSECLLADETLKDVDAWRARETNDKMNIGYIIWKNEMKWMKRREKSQNSTLMRVKAGSWWAKDSRSGRRDDQTRWDRNTRAHSLSLRRQSQSQSSEVREVFVLVIERPVRSASQTCDKH